jgi:hypothetical protein
MKVHFFLTFLDKGIRNLLWSQERKEEFESSFQTLTVCDKLKKNSRGSFRDIVWKLSWTIMLTFVIVLVVRCPSEVCTAEQQYTVTDVFWRHKLPLFDNEFWIPFKSCSASLSKPRLNSNDISLLDSSVVICFPEIKYILLMMKGFLLSWKTRSFIHGKCL